MRNKLRKIHLEGEIFSYSVRSTEDGIKLNVYHNRKLVDTTIFKHEDYDGYEDKSLKPSHVKDYIESKILESVIV